MKEKAIKKVILAYSGGLDTIHYYFPAQKHYNQCEVIAVAADVGQEEELEGPEERTLKTGTSKLYIEELTQEFVEDYTFPTLQSGAVYENAYLLGNSFAQPLIGKRLAEIAVNENANEIAHGFTGKVNDQVRFELAIRAFYRRFQSSRHGGYGICIPVNRS